VFQRLKIYLHRLARARIAHIAQNMIAHVVRMTAQHHLGRQEALSVPAHRKMNVRGAIHSRQIVRHWLDRAENILALTPGQKTSVTLEIRIERTVRISSSMVRVGAVGVRLTDFHVCITHGLTRSSYY